jgi:hypothetical protein
VINEYFYDLLQQKIPTETSIFMWSMFQSENYFYSNMCLTITVEVREHCILVKGVKVNIIDKKCHFITWLVIYKENPTRCNSVSKFYFIIVQQLHVQQPSTYAKPEAASAILGSWWWAECHPKCVELHINNEIKFWCTVASCWIFFVNYAMMHGSTNIKFTWLI